MSDPRVSPQELPDIESALRSSSSRYRNIPILEDPVRKVVTLGLYKRDPSVYEGTSNLAKFYEITSGTAHRPDLISQVAYNQPTLWWIIMEANNISGISELTAGRTLIIPNLDEVQTAIENEPDNSSIFA